jgi:glutaredoxin 3
MAKITIYTTPFCGYCMMAKRLLAQKNATFREVDVGDDWHAREQLMERAGGRRTVPQIWIGDTHVGGYSDLAALDHANKLDGLLRAR